jgi:hypothetical protein
MGIWEKIVDAAKEIMLRFGSTRWLALACALALLAYLGHIDRVNAALYAVLGSLLTAGCLLSFHRRPHSDPKGDA